MSRLILRSAEVDGERVDVRIDQGRIGTISPPGLLPGGDEEFECAGGALLPGLHDHHVHLLAMAARSGSLDVSRHLDQRLREAHARTPLATAIRAVNYDDVGEGPLDRWRLDALAPGRSVRVQHRSGALWVLSTVALGEAGIRHRVRAPEEDAPGIERDEGGRPTGRLFRLDHWLHQRFPFAAPPDLAAIGHRLASFGVTGVTDCTPTATLDYFDVLAQGVRTGALPLTVATTGDPELAEAHPPPPLRRGPVKVVIADHRPPSFEELRSWFTRAHACGRPVAVHCVTRASLLLALAVWREVGSVAGDRIEHASVAPPEVIAPLAELGLTVVTQPAFVADRGDTYLREVDGADRPDLYRCASFLEGGVAVGGSTDAPFGPDDPWLAVRAAMERLSSSGLPVGSDRALGPRSALNLFLGTLDRPGGPVRRIESGVPADLCLLDVPLHRALREPSSRHVAMTIRRGRPTFAA